MTLRRDRGKEREREKRRSKGNDSDSKLMTCSSSVSLVVMKLNHNMKYSLRQLILGKVLNALYCALDHEKQSCCFNTRLICIDTYWLYLSSRTKLAAELRKNIFIKKMFRDIHLCYDIVSWIITFSYKICIFISLSLNIGQIEKSMSNIYYKIKTSGSEWMTK